MREESGAAREREWRRRGRRENLVATARAAQTVLLFTMLQKQTLASQRSLHIAAVEVSPGPALPPLNRARSAAPATSDDNRSLANSRSLAQRELAV